MRTVETARPAPPGARVHPKLRPWLGFLAFLQLYVGVWAVVAPRHWYDGYPGFGRHWLPPLGSFNHHLSSDTGSGFLALGVGLVLAAVWLERRAVQVALAAVLAHAVPHFVFHVTNPAEGHDLFDVVVGVWGIAGEVALAAWLLVVATRSTRAAAA